MCSLAMRDEEKLWGREPHAGEALVASGLSCHGHGQEHREEVNGLPVYERKRERRGWKEKS